MKKIDLSALFQSMQDQMKAQLSTNKVFINHPSCKGDSLENAWIEWLKDYLPSRYSLDKAIIIDSNGETSDQIDLVIYDNWFTPFIFCQNGFKYIPAEGVYAVFEVKPDIKDNIKYAGKKVASVRRLKRTSTSMINSGNKFPPRPLTKIVGGILTITNSYTHNNNDSIKRCLEELTDLETLDVGCIADYGNFFVDYRGEEDPHEKDLERRINDYYKYRRFEDIVFSKMEHSLIIFFMKLIHYLQQSVGTIPAIDLNAYMDAIGEVVNRNYYS